MNPGKRPLSILILSCLYVVTGAILFAYHFPRPGALHYEDIWIELTELLAFVAGVSMLRGHNWARWLAVCWMAFHIAISYPALREIAVHTLFLVVIVWLLFQSRAGQYFASKGKERTSNE